MEHISLIQEKFKNKGLKRIFYDGYDMKVGYKYWIEILSKIIGKKPNGEASHRLLYEDLIKYVHGDKSYSGDLTKPIGIIGNTGSGKTKTIETMNSYSEIDNVKYVYDERFINFQFKIFNAREICEDFAINGYDGLMKYTTYRNICIDDLGAEPGVINYYGTKVDVITEIIEERYRKDLLTHFTSNLNEELIIERYNSRVHSRLFGSTNIHKLVTKDLRLI
jgi:DNA replication protein DnaC